MFPAEVPLCNDVDFQFNARQLRAAIFATLHLTAFLAAGDGRVVTMTQLMQAMGRQMTKQGRLPAPTDFKQYYPLIST